MILLVYLINFDLTPTLGWLCIALGAMEMLQRCKQENSLSHRVLTQVDEPENNQINRNLNCIMP